MLLLLILLLPACSSVVAYRLKSRSVRRALMIVTGLVHSILTGMIWTGTPTETGVSWIGLDSAGQLFLSLISILSFTSSWSVIAIWNREESQQTPSGEASPLWNGMEHTPGRRGTLTNHSPPSSRSPKTPEAIFTASLLMLLSGLSLVAVSQHFGVLWFALEVSAIACLPLIFSPRREARDRDRSLALTCFVGLTLALGGTFFLSQATLSALGSPIPFTVPALVQHAGELNPMWLRSAFLASVVGYGVLMGLSPVHSWMVTVQNESPIGVSALLAGALANGAFLALLRIIQVCYAAQLQDVVNPVLICAGLLSLLFTAGKVSVSRSLPENLAAISVGNMGLQVLAIGIGGVAVSGALLHLLATSLLRAMISLSTMKPDHYMTNSGTACEAGKSNVLQPNKGTSWKTVLAISGLFILCGLPPFAPFLSQFLIIQQAFQRGQVFIGTLTLAMLSWILIRLGFVVIEILLFGSRETEALPFVLQNHHERNAPRIDRNTSWLGFIPQLILALLVLGLFIQIPPGVTAVCADTATMLGGAGW